MLLWHLDLSEAQPWRQEWVWGGRALVAWCGGDFSESLASDLPSAIVYDKVTDSNFEGELK